MFCSNAWVVDRGCSLRIRRVVAAAIGLALAASPSWAQAHWRVTSSAVADRWFAAMAQLDLPVPGTLAFYLRAPRPPPSWRSEAVQTHALDVLHFVPLYFPSATPATLIAGLRAAATGLPAPTARASFLVSALHRTITAPSDRRLLILAAGLADSAPATPPIPEHRLIALQAIWDSVYAPVLAPYLSAQRLDGGLIFISPFLGPEGRIFEGRPEDRGDNVIAVGESTESGISEAPLLSAVRELCAPLITTSSAELRWHDDPVTAARATVRCGCALIDRALPSRSAMYRALWARHAHTATFSEGFPPNPGEDAAIDSALQRAFGARVIRH